MKSVPHEFNRAHLVSFVGFLGSALEIGPFTNPTLRGRKVKYFDVLDKQGLIERAKTINYVHSNPVNIHYVSAIGDLSVVNERFDFCFSSHCIEHQPDLIYHLNQVARVLNSKGRYLLVIPDKRYCFDHFISESSIADFINAQGRKVHSLKSVIEHRSLVTHNDPVRHWIGDNGAPVFRYDLTAVSSAISEYDNADGGYVDVHAWQFTPDSFRSGIEALSKLGMIGLEVEQVYATPHNSFEFCAILKRRISEKKG